MASVPASRYDENQVIIFGSTYFRKESNRICRKCEIKFEPEDEVVRVGKHHKCHIYHKNCFKRIE